MSSSADVSKGLKSCLSVKIPKVHLVQYRNWQSAITGTGRVSFRTIFGTGLCHFRYGRSLGPIPELDSMRVVSFLVPGSSSSGMVVVRVHIGSGLYVRSPISSTGLCHFRYGHSLGPVLEVNSMHVISFWYGCC